MKYLLVMIFLNNPNSVFEETKAMPVAYCVTKELCSTLVFQLNKNLKQKDYEFRYIEIKERN